MQSKYQKVTCCVCQRSGTDDKSDRKSLFGLQRWKKLVEIHEVRMGDRPYEWWFCSDKCYFQGCADKIVEKSIKEGFEIPARKKLVVLTCDRPGCTARAEVDELNRMLGGSVFGGWITLSRGRSSITDTGKTDAHVCSNECLAGFAATFGKPEPEE